MALQAYVFMNALMGDEKKVFNKVKSLESVKEAYMLYGQYDMVAKVYVKSSDDFKKEISNIRKIKGMRDTLTVQLI